VAQAAIDRTAASPYTSFSPRVAPSFSVSGGLLAVAGGLGLWVRVTSIDATGAAHQSASLSGAGSATGWFIAALGAAAAASSFVRVRRLAWLAPACTIGAVTLMALRLADLSALGSAMAFRAGARAGTAFVAYHAGFGWGAWAMTVALVALTLGTVVALLRALDERKGYVR
jgi:hypothetical protein